MSMAKQQSKSSIFICRIQLIAMFITATSLCLIEATHHPIHCAKWQTNCHKYDRYCTSEGSTENRVWNSCCEPRKYESSGDSSIEINRTRNLPSDIYSIKLSTYGTTMAWCDMTTDGGGWMVILRRADGIESFDRFYDEYEEGFGNLDRDFFFGLKVIHDLTSRDTTYEMRIDLYDQSNDTESSAHVVYKTFSIGPKECDNRSNCGGYRLHLDGFQPPEEQNNLAIFNKRPFIAKKRQQEYPEHHPCLQFGESRGGWWYLEEEEKCRGDIGKGAVFTGSNHRVSWFDPDTVRGKRFYEKVELKIRQNNCLVSDTL